MTSGAPRAGGETPAGGSAPGADAAQARAAGEAAAADAERAQAERLARFVVSDHARAALATVANLPGVSAQASAPLDPLALGEALRRCRPALGVAERAALVELVVQRRRASDDGGKLPGAETRHWFPERQALEQATPGILAQWHASLLGSAARIVDATAGLGSDTAAFAGWRPAAFGLPGVPAVLATRRVLALDTQAGLVVRLRATLAALGLARRATVRCAEALDWLGAPGNLAGVDAVYADPSRRVPDARGRTRRVLALAATAPSTLALLETCARAAVPLLVKCAPGLELAELPPGVAVAFVSVRGELKEALLASAGAAASIAVPFAAGRGAYVFSPPRGASEPWRVDAVTGVPAAPLPLAGAAGRYVWEPDPALARSELVSTVAPEASALGAAGVLLTAEGPPAAGRQARFFRVAKVCAVLALGQLRRYLKAHPAAYTLVRHGLPRESTERLGHSLPAPLAGARPLRVYLTWVGEQRRAVVGRPTGGRSTDAGRP